MGLAGSAACLPGGRFATTLSSAYGVRAPGMMTGGGGSPADSTDELKQLMVDAGLTPTASTSASRRGCAIVKCVVPTEAEISRWTPRPRPRWRRRARCEFVTVRA